MAAKKDTKPAATPQEAAAVDAARPAADPRSEGIEVFDDRMRGNIKVYPLAVNPNASALEAAIGVEARAVRLAVIMRNMSTGDELHEDEVLALHCYVMEIAGLASGVVDRLTQEASHG